ncbi:MAG TPA: GNAT family N-acetyltransferase [Herpetosiphonaceae bacterium]
MPAIELIPVTEHNFRDCVKLVVADDQTDYVASNLYTLAQSYVYPSWQPRAIHADGQLVGFVATGLDSETGHQWIIRFMIGKDLQGKGYGKAALLAIIDQLKAASPESEIRLSYVPGNEVAERLYRAVGFEATGEIDDGEVVMRLSR